MWFVVLASFLAVPDPVSPEHDRPPEAALQAYAQVLKRHVQDGRVDYRSLQKQDIASLDAFLEAVASRPLPRDRSTRIGWLVDAYNALVLKSVIDAGRPRSVLDVKGFFDTKTHKVAGRQLTLDDLEKRVLNPFAKDPRTHFVLVCGAVGCPILENRPFTGGKVEERMEKATRRYLASRWGARPEPGQLKVSKIFDWYAKDFGGAQGARAFILARVSDQVLEMIGDSPGLGFIDYNWTLNQR